VRGKPYGRYGKDRRDLATQHKRTPLFFPVTPGSSYNCEGDQATGTKWEGRDLFQERGAKIAVFKPQRHSHVLQYCLITDRMSSFQFSRRTATKSAPVVVSRALRCIGRQATGGVDFSSDPPEHGRWLRLNNASRAELHFDTRCFQNSTPGSLVPK
jgi:hypothetical protein